ncbi:hypothetical protein [Vannielia litorea]|uniref:hypothetical protein n=1 Tax=Vannielia litorea TaxID=1217970 RepID=UPI001BCCAFEE|nr:hypothetical protein [Vannielia litorea]MBS8224948.1 hypothetical protein [Vannielia litorea]
MQIDTRLKERLVTAGSVFAIALGTGFLMQQLSPVADRFASSSASSVAPAPTAPAIEALQPLSSALPKRPSEADAGPAAEDEAAIDGPMQVEADAQPHEDAALPQPVTQPRQAFRRAPQRLAAPLPGTPPRPLILIDHT